MCSGLLEKGEQLRVKAVIFVTETALSTTIQQKFVLFIACCMLNSCTLTVCPCKHRWWREMSGEHWTFWSPSFNNTQTF